MLMRSTVPQPCEPFSGLNFEIEPLVPDDDGSHGKIHPKGCKGDLFCILGNFLFA